MASSDTVLLRLPQNLSPSIQVSLNHHNRCGVRDAIFEIRLKWWPMAKNLAKSLAKKATPRKARDLKSADNKTPHAVDCIIVGAGISGLTCARELIDAGRTVLILEGRDRIGGRILTTRDTSLSVPIELGAEFIHGAPDVTFQRLESAGLTFYDLTDRHLQRKGGALVPVEFFEQIQCVMKSLDPKRKTDRTMDAVLKTLKSLSPDADKLLRAYIEGFHAADLNLIGEKALALSETGGADLNGSESFRIVEGYDRLVSSLLHGISMNNSPIRLQTIVKKISWKKSGKSSGKSAGKKFPVEIEAVSSADFTLPTFHAKAVVVTVPIGVLKAPSKSKTAIELNPLPPKLESALSGLHMGHALRLNLRFRSRFWEKSQKEPIGFLHAGPEWNFPTWWTQMPLRTPILIAWQGGPKVERLSKLTESERVQTALKTLSFVLDIDLKIIQQELVTWYMHDWTNDPFSLGAYSYVGLNGDQKALPLAQPFGKSLFFAGEATHTAAERGTVDGAIETGLRAAKQVLESL